MEATKPTDINFSRKVTRLDEEIVRFDSVLDRILKVFEGVGEDLKVYDKIVQVREVVFQLQQMMHGCEIVDFTAPWVDDDTSAGSLQEDEEGDE
jgi:hypothetical protein